MANFTEINALTEKYFLPTLTDNIFTSNVLLYRAREKGWYETKDGLGAQLAVPVAYAINTAVGWYDGAGELATTANDQIDALTFDWKQAHAAVTVNGRDERINGGKEGIINFVRAKTQLAEKTLSQTIGDGIYNAGTTTNAIIGLRLAIDSAGTYGGLSRTTYTWLASQEDSTTTTLSLTLIQGLYGDCTVGNSKPTVIVTTQDLWDIYWAKVQPQQRFQDTKTAQAGFMNILHNGTPIVVDGRCTAAHMFFINEDYMHFVVDSQRNFKWEPFIKPTNQDAQTAHIYWMGALACSNPRMQGKLGAITA